MHGSAAVETRPRRCIPAPCTHDLASHTWHTYHICYRTVWGPSPVASVKSRKQTANKNSLSKIFHPKGLDVKIFNSKDLAPVACFSKNLFHARTLGRGLRRHNNFLLTTFTDTAPSLTAASAQVTYAPDNGGHDQASTTQESIDFLDRRARVPQVSRGSRPGTAVVVTTVVCAQSPLDAASASILLTCLWAWNVGTADTTCTSSPSVAMAASRCGQPRSAGTCSSKCWNEYGGATSGCPTHPRLSNVWERRVDPRQIM
jgi:hypothetical protein